MYAFYVLLAYSLGILIGFKITIDKLAQACLIMTAITLLFTSFRATSSLMRLTLLISCLIAGLVRSSYGAVSFFPEEWFLSFQQAIIPLRESLVDGMGFGMTATQKELVGGIILGRGSGTIEIRNWNHFVQSGMSHLLVASGAQVSLTIFPIILLAENFKLPSNIRNSLFFAAGILLFVLLLLVGQEPSILRAITACYLYLAARLISRKAHSLNIIYVTALFWLFANPQLINDIGFRLSYAASWGLIYIYPRLRQIIPLSKQLINKFQHVKIIRKPLEYSYEIFLLCIAAQAAVIPVLAFHFHRISPSGFIANIIAIPICELATYTGLASAIIAQVYEPAAGILNIGNSFLLVCLDSIAHIFANVPHIFCGRIHWLGLILPYMFTGLLVEARFRPQSIILFTQMAYRFTHPIEETKAIIAKVYGKSEK